MPIGINGTGSITGISAGGLPDATITQAELATGVAGTGPAFRAFRSTNQTVTSSTWTKAQLTSEDYDTANCFDSATDYRFIPNVAGYYVFTAHNFASGSGTTVSAAYVAIYKNGSVAAQGGVAVNTAGLTALPTVSEIFYMNGTTDYVEMYGYVSATSPIFFGGSPYLAFSGCLLRAA